MPDARLSPWPPLPPQALGRRRRRSLPFPLDDERCSLYALGRHALHAGVVGLELRPGDEVLVPAYHHGSEVQALTEAGLVCVFYEATDDLAPAEDALLQLAGSRTRALLLVHYLGFPQDSARWRLFCDEHGLLLIEDAAQSWLAGVDGRPVGTTADLALFCLYKTYGLPDGAAAWLPRARLTPPPEAGLGATPLVRRTAAWLMARSGLLAGAGTRLERDEEYDADADFEFGTPSAPARTSLYALARVADAGTAALRRANYALLLEALAPFVLPAFAGPRPGASPFAFPIQTDHKAHVLAALSRRGIRALDFWSAPHPSLPADRFPRAAALRRTVIGLPVHQELRRRDLGLIAAVVEEAVRDV